MTNRSKKHEYMNQTFTTNEGYNIKIVDYVNSRNVTVEFDNGYRINAQLDSILKGRVSFPFHPSVYGVGCLGVGEYLASHKRKHTKTYKVWHSMMARCYSNSGLASRSTYMDCSVYEGWHCFQNFAKWYEDNYYEIEGEQMHLDKDILVKGNKVYSPDTCVFVPETINGLFVKSNAIRGALPIGVSYHKKDRMYYSRCNNQLLGKTITVGTFTTPEGAFEAYKEYKEKYIKEVAEKYRGNIPSHLYDALIQYEVEVTD